MRMCGEAVRHRGKWDVGLISRLFVVFVLTDGGGCAIIGTGLRAFYISLDGDIELAKPSKKQQLFLEGILCIE